MNAAYPGSRSEGAPVLQLDLDINPEAPSLARAAITGFTERGEIGAPVLALLNLLVSEVVTNAVVHAEVTPPATIRVSARMTEDSIRVEVTDRGIGFAPIARDPARSHGGYGLFLLAQQASRWGVDQHDGTTVWFELASRGPGD